MTLQLHYNCIKSASGCLDSVWFNNCCTLEEHLYCTLPSNKTFLIISFSFTWFTDIRYIFCPVSSLADLHDGLSLWLPGHLCHNCNVPTWKWFLKSFHQCSKGLHHLCIIGLTHVNRQPFTLTVTCVTCMCLHCRRKPEHPEETYTDSRSKYNSDILLRIDTRVACCTISHFLILVSLLLDV